VKIFLFKNNDYQTSLNIDYNYDEIEQYKKCWWFKWLSGKNDESTGPSLFKNDDLLDDEAYMRHLHKVEDSAIYPKFKSFCSEINSSKVCHRVEKFKILPREYDICEESISIHIRFLACDLQSNCAYKAQYAYINLNQKTFNITKFLSVQQKYL
jgi:coproporphyrinogen III oxidase